MLSECQRCRGRVGTGSRKGECGGALRGVTLGEPGSEEAGGDGGRRGGGCFPGAQHQLLMPGTKVSLPVGSPAGCRSRSPPPVRGCAGAAPLAGFGC